MRNLGTSASSPAEPTNGAGSVPGPTVDNVREPATGGSLGVPGGVIHAPYVGAMHSADLCGSGSHAGPDDVAWKMAYDRPSIERSLAEIESDGMRCRSEIDAVGQKAHDATACVSMREAAMEVEAETLVAAAQAEQAQVDDEHRELISSTGLSPKRRPISCWLPPELRPIPFGTGRDPWPRTRARDPRPGTPMSAEVAVEPLDAARFSPTLPVLSPVVVAERQQMDIVAERQQMDIVLRTARAEVALLSLQLRDALAEIEAAEARGLDVDLAAARDELLLRLEEQREIRRRQRRQELDRARRDGAAVVSAARAQAFALVRAAAGEVSDLLAPTESRPCGSPNPPAADVTWGLGPEALTMPMPVGPSATPEPRPAPSAPPIMAAQPPTGPTGLRRFLDIDVLAPMIAVGVVLVVLLAWMA